MAKHWLTKHGFEFEEVRLDTNPEAREFLISEGHRMVPQIYHNGKLLVSGGGQALVKMQPDQVRELIGEVNVGNTKL